MKLNLWIHEDEPEDLLVNGEILAEYDFPGGLKVGDLLEIVQAEAKGSAGSAATMAVLQVGSLSKLSNKLRAQISVSK